jgi:hypothetical protein
MRRSSLLAGVGDGMVATALALLAAGLTRDPLSVAMVFAAQHLPWAVVAVAGRSTWIDADRRTMLGLGVTLRAVAVAVVGLLTLAGAETVPVLVVAALAVGLGEALADQAETDAGAGPLASSSSGVGSPRRNGMVGLAVIGLPLGGLVYEVAAALPFLLDVGVFAVAALAALSLRTPLTVVPLPPRSAGTGPGSRPAPASALALAPGTGPVTVAAALSAAAGGAVSSLLVLFALDDLGLGAPAFGLVLAGLAGAATLGALAAPSVGGAVGLRGGMALALAVAGAGHAGAGLVGEPGRPFVAAGALGVAAAGSLAAAVLGRALLHVGAGRAVEGARLVAFHARVWAGLPVGALLGGVAARTLGVPGTLVACGVLSLAAAMVTVAVVPGRVPVATKVAQPERN